jgi:hypothetical protein
MRIAHKDTKRIVNVEVRYNCFVTFVGSIVFKIKTGKTKKGVKW